MIKGVSNFMAAPVANYTPGTGITYTATTGVMGGTQKVDVKFDEKEESLALDNHTDTEVKYITGGTLTISQGYLTRAMMETLGIYQKANTPTGQQIQEYKRTGKERTEVGCGYIGMYTKKVDGVKSVYYTACYFPRAVFSLDESLQTKAKDSDPTTHDITGTLIGAQLLNDASDEPTYVIESGELTTEAAAITWLKGKLNIDQTTPPVVGG